ncbi:MAG TPA: hypothetical protein VK982_13490, partial [Bacteroidales bacterium]|nr:hypothetical protein [Bacteroidales bacterium]
GNYMKLVKRTEIKKPEKTYNLHIKNNNNYIANDIVVSNCHGTRADVLQVLLSRCDNAKWRIGFTGTMPDDKLEEYQVMSYLGPVLKEYGSVELAKLGYVAECHIKMVHLSYDKEPKGTYDDVKNQVFRNEYRLSLIEEIIRNIDGSVLLLVGKVKDEGDFLLEYLNNKFHDEDKEVMFLSGRDSATEREKWRKYADRSKKHVVSLTFGNNIIKVDPNIEVPLSNGLIKKANEITTNDDVDDDWIVLQLK